MIRQTIRQTISEILQVRIQEGRWEAYTLPLDREGRFTKKTMISIIMALCEATEKQEQKISELEKIIDLRRETKKKTLNVV